MNDATATTCKHSDENLPTRSIFEPLGIDRSAFGPSVTGENTIQITHSQQSAGMPPMPKQWLDDLVRRPRLVGDSFTNAHARNQADEADLLGNENTRIVLDELVHDMRVELVGHRPPPSLTQSTSQRCYRIAVTEKQSMDYSV